MTDWTRATPEMLARALDRMALINEEAEGATPPMTEPLTHESLAELRRDAESWLMIGGERVLPLLNALDAARAERDALAAKLDAVRALHVAHDCTSHAGRATICAHRPGICLACLKPLPCPTIRALDAETSGGTP